MVTLHSPFAHKNTEIAAAVADAQARRDPNFTIGRFTSHFGSKGLQVLFFALNPRQF